MDVGTSRGSNLAKACHMRKKWKNLDVQPRTGKTQ